MKTFLIALAATTAFAGAAPAVAQYGGSGVPVRSDQLRMQLQAGVRSGAITRAEAIPLREQLRQLTRLEMLYARDGINGRERADLQHRINSLRQDIRIAHRGDDGRYGDGRYDRDDDRRGGGYDRSNDGWDDRYGDREGRWENDDGYGRDQGSDRGVVGQIVDRLTGHDGLRVGQRASADLDAVPYAYRSRYRDGAGAYYRSDGRRIYQIDARTETVIEIYPMNR